MNLDIALKYPWETGIDLLLLPTANKVEPRLISWHFSPVSANDIIAELPKLKREDLERVDARVHELREPVTPAETSELPKKLKRFAGQINDLPRNMAENHDHYLHGRSKK